MVRSKLVILWSTKTSKGKNAKAGNSGTVGVEVVAGFWILNELLASEF